MHYYVNKLRQNVGLETCKWREIVTSQTANTKYKWPSYDPEPTPPHENFLLTPLGEGVIIGMQLNTDYFFKILI